LESKTPKGTDFVLHYFTLLGVLKGFKTGQFKILIINQIVNIRDSAVLDSVKQNRLTYWTSIYYDVFKCVKCKILINLITSWLWILFYTMVRWMWNHFIGLCVYLCKDSKQNTMGNLLYIIAVILVIMWLLGFFIFHLGTLIHWLLVIAVIAILLKIIRWGAN